MSEMTQEKITSLWEDLEKLLKLLDIPKQIWLMQNFIEKAQRFLGDVKEKNKDEKVIRSAKKKKRKKKLERNESILEESKEKEIHTKEENIREISQKTFPNFLQPKSITKKEEFKVESLNLDSLINSYKQDSDVDLVDPIEKLSDEDEEDTGNKIEDNKQEVQGTELYEDSALKSSRFSRLFKKDRRDKEKVRSAIINKKQDDDEERAGKILMPLMRTLNGETSKWGGVHFSAKKIVKSSDKKRPLVPHFWDDIKESNDDEPVQTKTTFTGIRKGTYDKGPKINTQDQAMKVLGIGTEATKEGAKRVSLSTYTQKDILKAFREKLREGSSKTNTMQDVHESYQIVRRVMNSKNKFRNFGKGAVKSEKITELLTTLKKEGEEEKLKQQKNKKAGIHNDRLKLALKNRKGTLRVANLLKSAPKEDPSKMEEKPPISEEANNSLKSFRFKSKSKSVKVVSEQNKRSKKFGKSSWSTSARLKKQI